jgi:hypothetical protein
MCGYRILEQIRVLPRNVQIRNSQNLSGFAFRAAHGRRTVVSAAKPNTLALYLSKQGVQPVAVFIGLDFFSQVLSFLTRKICKPRTIRLHFWARCKTQNNQVIFGMFCTCMKCTRSNHVLFVPIP